MDSLKPFKTEQNCDKIFISLTVSKLIAYFIVEATTQKGVFESITIQQTFRRTMLVGKIINLFLASVIFIDDVSELA